MAEGPDDPDSEDGEEPLDGLAAEVARRRAADAGKNLTASVDNLDEVGEDDRFSEEPFEAVEVLWESLDVEDATLDDQSKFDSGEGVGTTVVLKRNFCEQCEYFSEPPVARCNHEGTQIVEFVDRQRVRVRRCPVVAQRRAIGQIDPDA